jgi:hypothetical protein
MKTTLVLAALVACCLTAIPQNAPAPAARPERMDPIRFSTYDLNRDGRVDRFEQEVERQTRAADLARQGERIARARESLAERRRQFDLEHFDAN